MKRLNIGPRALLTTLLVVVPTLLVLSVVLVRSTGAILRENATRQVRDLATKSVHGVDELLKRSQQTLLTVADGPTVTEVLDAVDAADGSSPGLEASLGRLEATFLHVQKLDPTIQAIRLIDEDGNVIVKVREGAVFRRQGATVSARQLPVITSIRGRDFFRATMALERGKVWISNLERGQVEGEPEWCPGMVRFSTPIFFRSGARAGMVIINVWGRAVGQILERLISEAEGSAFLTERNVRSPERNGIYLFNPGRCCEFGDQTGTRASVFDHFPATITDAWMKEDAGIHTNPRTGDILAHVFLSPYGLTDRGWVVVIDARRDFFMGPLSTIRTRIVLLAAVALAAVVIAALFITRSVTGPIRQVIDGTRRLRQDLSTRITVRSGDELGYLADEINRMAAALQENLEHKARVEQQIRSAEKLASIGEMAAGLAHELRTPLSNIRALTSLARKSLDSGEIDSADLQADLGDIAEQTDKCSNILTGLLDFARRQNPQLGPHDVHELIDKSLSLVRLRLEKKEVAAVFLRNDSVPSVTVDGPLMQQVFVNLLLNAIDAVRPAGRIEISAESAGDRVRVRIADDGVGIAPEHLPKIFNPFFTTKEVGKGTGLGLSVSYGIVTSQGGSIEVESTPGAGSVFTVALIAEGIR
ncbi:MAG: HAMP domain-containing protein [Deltaproteobacteria bacterium]|nr:HAMP domain-containing protein [Deltaproteobacteria bacterium]